MVSQPQNPEYRNNPQNFHPWIVLSVGLQNSVDNKSFSFLFLFSNLFLNHIFFSLTTQNCQYWGVNSTVVVVIIE